LKKCGSERIGVDQADHGDHDPSWWTRRVLDLLGPLPDILLMLLDVFEKGDKITIPRYRPGIDLGIDLEEGNTISIQKMYTLSYDQLEELHRYIRQKEDPE